MSPHVGLKKSAALSRTQKHRRDPARPADLRCSPTVLHRVSAAATLLGGVGGGVCIRVLAVRLRVVVWAVVGCAMVCLAGAGPAGASGWESQAVPLPARPDGELSAVSCTSRRACTAVGSFFYSTNDEGTAPLVQRWNGIRWSIQTISNLSFANAAYSSLSGVSCTSIAACVAVGSYNNDSGPVTVIERLNGTRWSIQPSAQRAGGWLNLEAPVVG